MSRFIIPGLIIGSKVSIDVYKRQEHTLKIGIDDRELLGAIDQEVYRNSLRQACLLYTSRCV